MNTRQEITATLSLALEKKINPYNDPRIYWAKEVTFDYSTNHAVRVDYMRYKPVNNTVSGIEKGDFYCYEVKSSVEDFRSGHGLNFLGDYNYLVMPERIYATISLHVRLLSLAADLNIISSISDTGLLRSCLLAFFMQVNSVPSKTYTPT